MTIQDHSPQAHEHSMEPQKAASFLTRGRWIFCVFAIIAAIFLISEHRAHALGALPYLLLLACPLMHVFMHGGHGGHGGHGRPGGHSSHGGSTDGPSSSGKPRDGE